MSISLAIRESATEPLFPDDAAEGPLADRRSRAKRSIRRCAGLWGLGHAVAAAALAAFYVTVAAAIGGDGALRERALSCALAAAAVAATLLILPAARSAYVAIRHRSILSRAWIAFGLTAWLALSAEGAGLLLLGFAWGS